MIFVCFIACVEAFECINVNFTKLKVQALAAGGCTLSYNGASVTVQGSPNFWVCG